MVFQKYNDFMVFPMHIFAVNTVQCPPTPWIIYIPFSIPKTTVKIHFESKEPL